MDKTLLLKGNVRLDLKNKIQSYAAYKRHFRLQAVSKQKNGKRYTTQIVAFRELK